MGRRPPWSVCGPPEREFGTRSGPVGTHNGAMEPDYTAEARSSRRHGDPRLTPNDRAILRRITTGDLADEFAVALAEACSTDSLLGGDPDW